MAQCQISLEYDNYDTPLLAFNITLWRQFFGHQDNQVISDFLISGTFIFINKVDFVNYSYILRIGYNYILNEDEILFWEDYIMAIFIKQ